MGFRQLAVIFLDVSDIHQNPEERPEDLFQRLSAFVEDNLLCRNNGITHHGAEVEEDEEMSPSLENFVVLTWLHLLHPDLPRLIKQRYGTELRSRTLASIKPEMSQALSSLLDEVHTSEDVKIMRTATSRVDRKNKQFPQRQHTPISRESTSFKVCILCKAAGRVSNNHFLSQCSYLPAADPKYMARARHIANILDDTDSPKEDVTNDDTTFTNTASEIGESARASSAASIFCIQVKQSPYINAFYGHQVACLTIDSGATGNMIRLSAAKMLGVKIEKSSQFAHQADGLSPLKVVGETKFIVVRDKRDCVFEGLVVEQLDVDILAGIPFMEINDITVRPAKHQVILGNGTTYAYGSCKDKTTQHTVRRTHVIHAPSISSTVWPGEYIEVNLPDDMIGIDDDFAIEPRLSVNKTDRDHTMWPTPDIVTSVAGKIRIPNLTDQPQVLKRHEHFCQVHSVSVRAETEPFSSQCSSPTPRAQVDTKSKIVHSDFVHLDPDNTFPINVKAKFQDLMFQYDVFNPKIEGYNGSSGPFQAVVNMGPVQPPQRKGRISQYSRDKLTERQKKFDDLEEVGVFVSPEDVDVAVEYLNPSFLIKKPNGSFRLVTAFADVGRYSKPQPSLMPDVDSILRQIASWKYIIKTDLTQAFYQIPLQRESMKYCGVATPFKGVRVYAKCAMGMPGSETALEELMCRVLGDLLQEGVLTKLADDLYCGANNLEDLLKIWHRILDALQTNNLTLSAKKTVIGPVRAMILRKEQLKQVRIE